MKPIFIKNLKSAPNIHCGFRQDFTLNALPKSLEIHLGARTFYRLFINGEFVCHGNARAGFDHVRIDKIDILDKAQIGENKIAVEVASYGNYRNYSNDCTCEDGVLLVDLFRDEKLILESDESFKAILLKQRKTNVDNYSHCREISELYYLDREYFTWTVNDVNEAVEVLPACPQLIERGMDYPEYNLHNNFEILEFGSLIKVSDKNHLHFYEKLESIEKITERPSSDCENEKEIPFTGEFLRTKKSTTITQGENTTGSYLIFDAKKLMTGFKGIKVFCEGDAVIDFIHTERIEKDGHLSAVPSQNTALRLHLTKGEWKFLSFEPYTMRYFKLVIRSSKPVVINNVFVVDYIFPDYKMGSFLTSDERINRVFEAAKLTLNLNTLDIFMDCPDRERGGWLCDSFWSGRAQKMMFGDNTVEKAMLENFLHHPKEEQLVGLLPAVYPGFSANNKEGKTINTWTFWLLLEVFDYVKRSGDKEMLVKFEDNVTRLIEGILTYKNKYDLLESIPGFTFIDWGLANNAQFNSPISTPCNMLFAKVLKDAGEMYKNDDWLKNSRLIVEAVKKYAISNDGVNDSLNAPSETQPPTQKDLYSEAAHYTSFWTNLLDVPDIKEKIILRENNMAGTKFAPANMFIGYCIRHDLLSNEKEIDLLVKESVELYTKMIDQGPGTLWETFDGKSSRCHGFASHIGYLYMKDILGINEVDELNKTIKIAPNTVGLKWAKGTATLNDGVLSISWTNKKDQFEININAPKGYKVEFDKTGVYNGKNKVIVNSQENYTL